MGNDRENRIHITVNISLETYLETRGNQQPATNVIVSVDLVILLFKVPRGYSKQNSACLVRFSDDVIIAELEDNKQQLC